MTINIVKIYSYLTYPGKKAGGDESKKVEDVAGADIPLSGTMFEMLKGIFDHTDIECKTPISFSMNGKGQQQNQVRDELIAFLKKPTQENGLFLARRLQDVTTERSGLGLLFITFGKGDNQLKVVISRFPADQGVLAERDKTTLSVSFVERVFMKNAHAYKAIAYEGSSFDNDFWDGMAVDRQTAGAKSLANYWIQDFLKSDFKITPKAGTKQLALALRQTSKKTSDENAKREIISAANLASNLDGETLSINSFMKRYGLSDTVKEAVVATLSNSDLADVDFKFDREEFSRHIHYTSKELDSGAILTAPSDNFDKCFNPKKIDNDKQEYEFTARGKIVNQRLRSSKL